MNLQSGFNDWLEGVIPNQPPENVRAYNFNISETASEWIVEILGSSEFDPNDSDWPCDEAWTCRPSCILLPMSEVGTDWQSAELYILELVRRFLQNAASDKARLLRESEAVAVGFVGGDLAYVLPEPPTLNNHA